jgi:hypothetical protein
MGWELVEPWFNAASVTCFTISLPRSNETDVESTFQKCDYHNYNEISKIFFHLSPTWKYHS